MTWDLPPPAPLVHQPYDGLPDQSIPIYNFPNPTPAWPTPSLTDQHEIPNFPTFPNSLNTTSTSQESFLSSQEPQPTSPPKVLSTLDLQPTYPSQSPIYSLQSYQPVLQSSQFSINDVASSPELVNFLDSGSFSDVGLIAGDSGREFRAHKVILAAKSPIFSGMFALLDYEKNLNIEIREVREDVMYELLKFVYEGRIERIESCAFQLCLAAEKFEIPALRERCCEGFLKEDRVCIGDDNVYEIVEFSKERGIGEMMRRAVEYVIGVY